MRCQYCGEGGDRVVCDVHRPPRPGDRPLLLLAKGWKFTIVPHSSNYMWWYGVQRREVDGRPGESFSRRTSWCALFPPRSIFEGGCMGTSRLVTVCVLTRGCG
jgi:hypothetical protein